MKTREELIGIITTYGKIREQAWDEFVSMEPTEEELLKIISSDDKERIPKKITYCAFTLLGEMVGNIPVQIKK